MIDIDTKKTILKDINMMINKIKKCNSKTMYNVYLYELEDLYYLCEQLNITDYPNIDNYSNKSSASNNNKSASYNSNKSYNSSNSTPKPETTTKQQTDNREHPANGTVIYSRPNWGDYYDYGKNWQYAEITYEWKVDEYGGYWSSSTTSNMSYENLVKYVDNNLQEPDREGSYTGEKVTKQIWVWIE